VSGKPVGNHWVDLSGRSLLLEAVEDGLVQHLGGGRAEGQRQGKQGVDLLVLLQNLVVLSTPGMKMFYPALESESALHTGFAINFGVHPKAEVAPRRSRRFSLNYMTFNRLSFVINCRVFWPI